MRGIIIDEISDDLLLERGRIAIGETVCQTAEAVVKSIRGEIREHPMLGGEAMMLEGEKLDETEEDLLQHRTDGTDAFDTLYIGCERMPQQLTDRYYSPAVFL